MTIIITILSVIFGAWVNNVFTWKIKNKIEVLDKIFLEIEKYNTTFLNYCKEACLHDQLKPMSQVSINEFNGIVTEIQNEMYLDFFIVDDKKVGELYQIMLIWNKCLDFTP